MEWVYKMTRITRHQIHKSSLLWLAMNVWKFCYSSFFAENSVLAKIIVMKQQQIYVSFPIVTDERYGKTHSSEIICSTSYLQGRFCICSKRRLSYLGYWDTPDVKSLKSTPHQWLHNCSNSHVNAYSPDKQVWTQDWLAVFFSNCVLASTDWELFNNLNYILQ